MDAVMTAAPCAYCACPRDGHYANGSCRRRMHPAGQGSCYGYVPAPDDSDVSEYRQGFLAGYLQAHEDGHEYGCSVFQAKVAYEAFKAEGGRDAPLQNVEGW